MVDEGFEKEPELIGKGKYRKELGFWTVVMLTVGAIFGSAVAFRAHIRSCVWRPGRHSCMDYCSAYDSSHSIRICGAGFHVAQSRWCGLLSSEEPWNSCWPDQWLEHFLGLYSCPANAGSRCNRIHQFGASKTPFSWYRSP